MTIFILTSLVVAALDIEVEVGQDKDSIIMIMLLSKNAFFLSFLNDILEEILMYCFWVGLAFSSQPKQGYFAERLNFLAIAFFNLFSKA